jgi:hypothetical protein
MANKHLSCFAPFDLPSQEIKKKNQEKTHYSHTEFDLKEADSLGRKETLDCLK